MENELPATLAFLIPLILQCTGKPPSSFNFCTKTALSERARLCLPRGVSATQCPGTGKETERMERSRWDSGHFKGPTGFGKSKKKGQTEQKSTLCSQNSSLFPGAAPFAGGCPLRHCPAHPGDQDPALPACPALPGTEIHVPPLAVSSQQPGELGWGREWHFPELPEFLCFVASQLCCFPGPDSEYQGIIKPQNGLGWKGP